MLLHQLTKPWIEQLPRELLHRVFRELLEGDDHCLRWMSVLSSVCRRWNMLCQDPLLWEFVARRTFVAYPLVVRLPFLVPSEAALVQKAQGAMATDAPDNHSGVHHAATNEDPIREAELLVPHSGPPGRTVARRDTQPAFPPTRQTMKEAVEGVRVYRARQEYYQYVQRRRSFVLHLFLSITLLCFSLSIGTAMCAAEGIEWGWACQRQTTFAFLWLSYVSITAIIVANVVMQAHFEPQPLLQRLKNNKLLITASFVTMVLGICDVMVPTFLIQVNLAREERFSWLWCGATVIGTFCVWQCYALFCIMPDAREHLHHQLAAVNVKEGFQFVLLNVPNAFPTLFAVATFCGLQYVQHGSRFYVLIGGMPVAVSLGVMALVFLLDFCALRRYKDLAVGACLLVALFFPLSLVWWDFRGYCLLPLVLASFGFFATHAYFVVKKALSELLHASQATSTCVVAAPANSVTPLCGAASNCTCASSER